MTEQEKQQAQDVCDAYNKEYHSKDVPDYNPGTIYTRGEHGQRGKEIAPNPRHANPESN